MADDGSFAGWLKDVVNSVPILGSYTNAAWGPGNYDPNAAPTKDVFSPDASFQERIGSVVNTIPFLHVAGEATTTVSNNFAPLKFVLDFGNRTADSFFTGAQAEDDSNPSTSFFDGWRQGWDSWGSPDHLTAGQIVGASLNNGLAPTGLSPFTPQGVKDTQTAAKQTWYGEVAGAATDISAGFLGVPVGKAAQLTKLGKTLETAADADQVAQAFNAGERAGKTESLFKPYAPQVQASRIDKMAAWIYDRSESMVDAMNALGPLTEQADGRATRLLAEIATTARTRGRDMGQHIIANAMLTAMGSDAARAELISSDALLAAKMANGTMAPQVFGDAVKAHELLVQQYKADPSKVDLQGIMSQVYDTPRKMAEQKALAAEVEKATQEADQVKNLRQRMAGLRPRNRMFVNGQSFDLSADNLTIKEGRLKAESQYNDLRGTLDEAKANLGAAKQAGDEKALGAAQQKVDDLTQSLSEAKADFDLLKSTPLDENGYTLPQWRADMAKAGSDSKVAAKKRDMLIALNRTAKRELKGDAAQVQQIMPGLNATNQWLTDLDTLGQTTDLATLNLVPSKLERLKTAFRNDVGASYLYDSGEFNRKMIFHVMPTNWAANIGTAYGRSAINVLDRYTGLQELGMYLKKSKVYSGDEIRQISEDFLHQPDGQVAQFVAKANDDMLDRIVRKVAPDLSEEDVANAVGNLRLGMNQQRTYLTSVSKQADAEGAQWATLHELPGMDSSDAIHRVDAAFLRSHVAETQPFADPFQLTRALRDYQNHHSLKALGNTALDGVDLIQQVWKLGALIRPGLMVRNMLDSNVRALAIMGTVPTMMSAMNGLHHLDKNIGARVGDWVSTKNAKIPGLQKIAVHNPNGFARTIMNSQDIKLGGKTHTISLYGKLENGDVDGVGLAMGWTAMNKGSSPSQGLLTALSRPNGRFRENRQIWKDYKADAQDWPKAYSNHAEVLLASPTAKKLIEWQAKDELGNLSSEQLMRELFSDPAVRKEYTDLLTTHNMDQHSWVEQVLRETEVMFPEPGMAQDLLSGRFKGKAGEQWINSHFPKDQRFDVPGFETVFEAADKRGDHASHLAREAVNATFRALQDAPDFWLARHPVAYHAFRQRADAEAEALYRSRVAKYGEDAEFTDADIAKIERRARTHAISTVRTYMYDATRNTGLSASSWLHRLVPFFAPWQDTMRAYSRLLLDDPSRLGRIAGVYNVPFNANTWMADPFIVDDAGNMVARGDEPKGGKFILVGGKWGTNAEGKKVLNGGFKLRADSFNTILQGQIPWLPGWGPAVQIPVQTYLNSNKELALQLSQSDNPAIQTLMKSLFMDGEVPMGDDSSLLKTMMPAWLRRFLDAKDGVTFGRNVGYLLNAKYMEAMANGQPFDYKRAYADAQAEATAAAWPLLVSQFGFGISGDAQVQGKFYVDKMHEFQALSDPPPGGGPSPLEVLYGKGSDPTKVFAQMFPEAKGLSWSFTRNETGINATVTAQDSALRNKALIDENPALGWFILGGDNVGGAFSQTAYNQQKTDTFGPEELSRKQLSNGEIMSKVRISQGWADYTKYATELSNLATSQGLDSNTISTVRQLLVAQIGQQNPGWYAEFNNNDKTVQDFYQRADLLAKDPRLANRQDIAMYATYRQAMQQVLDTFGLKSFTGSSDNSAAARAVMFQVGQQMSRQNIGFQQMWDRILVRDVQPKPEDRSFASGNVSGANTSITDAG